MVVYDVGRTFQFQKISSFFFFLSRKPSLTSNKPFFLQMLTEFDKTC